MIIELLNDSKTYQLSEYKVSMEGKEMSKLIFEKFEVNCRDFV